ncbi:YkvI family membrane protein [Haloplasma contractile]|uniref:Membrane protein YkvI n=1 Tax=Haloplasma contractile SSD-17B TaxID=1033810 RepID=U2EA99_9MOLU|nr:membrane protein [Haloplasma contractile]ERJ12018.1 hypothetical protein HLPCO_001932 [Haloplasma contractile SSD-17B]
MKHVVKRDQEGQIGIFKIAATYIGTVVGAGFASGQEVLQFFSSYGLNGVWGIALAVVLFFFFGYTILLLGKKLNADSHVQVVRFSNGKIFGTIIDLIITFFLFGVLSAMIAGTGAIVAEQFGISPFFGTLLMTILPLLTVMSGITGVINSISYIVPILLLSVLSICIYSIVINPLTVDEIELAREQDGATPFWIVSGINYASYNLVMAVSVLGPLGTKGKDRRSLFLGALFGALGLGIGILAIYYSVLTNIEEAVTVEIPMVTIAGNIGRIIQIIFSVVLIAEVYTTAVGGLYGFVSRTDDFTGEKYRKMIIIGTSIGAFLLAQIGFSKMVKIMFPLVGYGGFLLFIGLIYVWLFKRDELRE